MASIVKEHANPRPDVEGSDVQLMTTVQLNDRVAKARASDRLGETIPGEEIKAWVDSWDTDHELPQPRVRS